MQLNMTELELFLDRIIWRVGFTRAGIFEVEFCPHTELKQPIRFSFRFWPQFKDFFGQFVVGVKQW